MIVYFTGTGNSRYCAHFLADRLQDTATDAFPFIRNKVAAALTSETPWIFVAPTYAWQLPHIFESFLRSGRFTGNQNAYFVMTCGAEIGAPQTRIQALCREIGLTYQGVLQVVMPENYIAMFGAPEAAEARTIIHAAHPTLETAAALIRAGQPFPFHRAGVLDRVKSGPVNPLFYRLCVRAKPFRATERCVGCGKCAAVCPLDNIHLQTGHPVWGPQCTHCMACICTCPVQAIEYGTHSQGKPRYQCPDYPLPEAE